MRVTTRILEGENEELGDDAKDGPNSESKQENEDMVGNRGIFILLPTAVGTGDDSVVLLRAFISSISRP